MKEAVRSYLDAKHPIINTHANGVDTPVSAAEREALLDEWTTAFIDDFFVKLRRDRDALLASSDWTQAADAPVDAAAWAKYRQALRDLPAKIKDPTAEVNWPTPPV